MQLNFWSSQKYLDQHKTFWDLQKDKVLEKCFEVHMGPVHQDQGIPKKDMVETQETDHLQSDLKVNLWGPIGCSGLKIMGFIFNLTNLSLQYLHLTLQLQHLIPVLMIVLIVDFILGKVVNQYQVLNVLLDACPTTEEVILSSVKQNFGARNLLKTFHTEGKA